MATISDYQKSYNDAKARGDSKGMADAHAGAEAIRNSQGYSGGADGSQRNPISAGSGDATRAAIDISKFQDVKVSSSNNPGVTKTLGATTALNGLTTAERYLVLNAQPEIRNDTRQYAYKDEYGMVHVASLASALANSKDADIRQYDGPSAGGYAIDSSGERAQLNMANATPYGNIGSKPGQQATINPATGTLADPYNLSSLGRLATASPTAAPIISTPSVNLNAPVTDAIPAAVAAAMIKDKKDKKSTVPLNPAYPNGYKYGDAPPVKNWNLIKAQETTRPVMTTPGGIGALQLKTLKEQAKSGSATAQAILTSNGYDWR